MSAFDGVIKDLNGLGDTLRRGLIDDAEDITAPVIDQAQVYGPKLPDQVYQRTNALAEGWEDSEVRIKATSSGVQFSHTNPVEYVMFVQGVGEQAGLFEGRWDDLQAVADKAEQATVERATRSIADELGRF